MAFSLQPELVGSLLLPSWTPPPAPTLTRSAPRNRPDSKLEPLVKVPTWSPGAARSRGCRQKVEAKSRGPASASRGVGRKQRWSEEENRDASGLWPKRGSASLLSRSAKEERKHHEPPRPQTPQGPTDEARWGPRGLGCRTGHL